MEKRSVRGLSLRGSMYALNRARPHRKKLAGKPSGRASSVASSPDRESVAAMSKTITSVDVLMRELRKCIHATFCTVDPSFATTNLYDNYSQQAFRFFTTTNTITPEAFHHKVVKLGLSASRVLCMELFGRIDQEDLGEINYATFARRIFLPPGRFNFEAPVQAIESTSPMASGLLSPPVIDSAKPQERLSTNSDIVQSIKAVRPTTGARSLRPSSPAPSPRKRPPTSGSLSGAVSPRQLSPPTPTSGSGERLLHHHIITALRSPRALNADGIALIYEHMSLDEIERCISQKLEEKTSKGTDRFRQAFRIFTKSEGITFSEFYHHLELLQIHLSPAKCRALFNRFDLDGNGTIELSEFTAAIFSKQEQESDLITPSASNKHELNGHVDFEVEAGSSLTTDQILARLREKLEQHTSKETDRFRQAYKIFQKSSGITPQEFNAAMGKLGMKLTDKQVHELFALFDFDKSGDLDLNEFVQGVMLDDCPSKLWTSVKDRQRLEESRRTLYSMAVQSVQSSWTIAEIEQMLRAKIEQRTSRSSDCFRQAFRIFKKVNGIKPDEFHAALERIGLALDRSQSDVLFNRFDANGSGDIDLDEFIHGVLPPDYTGSQWVAAADELHRIAEQQKKLEAKQRPDQYMTEIEMESWSLDEIEKKIRDKIQQATSKSSDIFRQAYKIFKKTNHVTIDEFRDRLLTLGFRLTPAQCQGLFQRYDTNNSNDIDLQEFCMRILPPDYTGDGDYWSHSQNFHKQKQRERLEYVKRTKNGLLMLPKFDESRRYTKGHYTTTSFSDLDDSAQTPTLHDTAYESNGLSSGAEPVRPTSPTGAPAASRPSTPRTSRPVSATSLNIRASLAAEPSESRENIESLSTSPSRWIGDGARPSPRKLRVASGDVGEKRGPSADSLKLSAAHAPMTPSRPSPARPPMSPRESAKVSSPRCATPSRAVGASHFIAEFEDDEILEDGETMSSMDLIRAKRRERRRQQHEEHARRTPRSADEESLASGYASKYTESVAASSTMSVSSTESKGVGTAKYTPQRSHTLLIKRFLQVSKRSASPLHASSPSASKGNSPQPKRR